MESIATRFAVAYNRYASVQVDMSGAGIAYSSDLSVCVRPTVEGEYAVMHSNPMKNGRYKLIGTCHTERGFRSLLALHQ